MIKSVVFWFSVPAWVYRRLHGITIMAMAARPYTIPNRTATLWQSNMAMGNSLKNGYEMWPCGKIIYRLSTTMFDYPWSSYILCATNHPLPMTSQTSSPQVQHVVFRTATAQIAVVQVRAIKNHGADFALFVGLIWYPTLQQPPEPQKWIGGHRSFFRTWTWETNNIF